MEEGITEGIRLFNAGRFFEAHEALEAVWLEATGSRKKFLHGLIQVAAAFHHHARRNPAGLHSLLEKGCEKLETSGLEAQFIDLPDFLCQLQPWRKRPDTSSAQTPAAPLPIIKVKGKT